VIWERLTILKLIPGGFDFESNGLAGKGLDENHFGDG
jgi:hypothetical protein